MLDFFLGHETVVEGAKFKGIKLLLTIYGSSRLNSACKLVKVMVYCVVASG